MEEATRREELTLAHLKRDRVLAVEGGGDVIREWPVFRCLTGELEVDGRTYLLEDGDVFEVEPDYLKDLDRYLDELEESDIGLPDSPMRNGEEETEGDYNRRASETSDTHLLLDKETVKVDTHTSPIEICDVLTTDRRFVHVKRKLQSASLSHLFSQGYVSADLFLMSPDYRTATRDKIAEAERERAGRAGDPSFRGRFQAVLDFDTPNTSLLEVVYAIVAKWGGRSLVGALPFFSKVNLRRHADDLRRMGYRVSYKRIEVA